MIDRIPQEKYAAWLYDRLLQMCLNLYYHATELPYDTIRLNFFPYCCMTGIDSFGLQHGQNLSEWNIRFDGVVMDWTLNHCIEYGEHHRRIHLLNLDGIYDPWSSG